MVADAARRFADYALLAERLIAVGKGNEGTRLKALECRPLPQQVELLARARHLLSAYCEVKERLLSRYPARAWRRNLPRRGLHPKAQGEALGTLSAISQVLPSLHGDEEAGVHPISGRLAGNRRLALTERSPLTIRLHSDRVSEVSFSGGRQKVILVGRGSPAHHT